MEEETIEELLLKNVELQLPIKILTDELLWGKSLVHLPVFTKRDIDLHMRNCGKKRLIKKTSVRGRLFRDEGFLNNDSIHTAADLRFFYVKCKCKASMKKEYRNVQIQLSKRSGRVQKASCSCPAGMSGYCNHIMALMYEIAEYSLNSLDEVPQEKACTSKLRKWGVPGNKEAAKHPILCTTLFSKDQKKGIQPTLYDPRLNFNLFSNLSDVNKLKTRLAAIDTNIGYAHIIPDHPVLNESSKTKFGLQLLGSPLSYQLLPIDYNFKVLTNLCKSVTDPAVSVDLDVLKLPLRFLHWQYDMTVVGCSKKLSLLDQLVVSEEQSLALEESTRQQAESLEWKKQRENRLTSTSAHKIFIRKKNFETLACQLAKPTSCHRQVDIVRNAMDHGIRNEEVAKEKYCFVMNYRICMPVKIRNTGLVVQPKLYWLGASPDGVVYDKGSILSVGLLEVKCPYSHRKSDIETMVQDKTFYIGINRNCEYYLKPDHHLGYYTQVQLAMGLSGTLWCHFVVYVYDGIIIVKVDFDEEYFSSVINKMNQFYKQYYLEELVKNV